MHFGFIRFVPEAARKEITMDFRAIKPFELETWTDLCGVAFKQGPTEFYNNFVNDPYADYDGIFVACDDGKMVSSVRVLTRQIYIDGQPVNMGGIGEVCTLEAYRLKGLSTILLNMAVEYMKQHNQSVSLLYTGSNYHYARCGWFTFPQRYVNLTLSACTLPFGYRIRPPMETDAPALIELHHQYVRQYNGMTVRRDVSYWNRWISKMGHEQLVLEHAGTIIAYFVYNIENGDQIRFREYIGAPEHMTIAFNTISAETGFIQLLGIPAPFLPEITRYSERTCTMARLNLPFTINQSLIDTNGKLAAMLADSVLFPADGF